MLGEHIQLLERASVQQQVEPLARGELALLVLRLDALLPAAEQRLLFALAQVFELLTCRLHRMCGAETPALRHREEAPLLLSS